MSIEAMKRLVAAIDALPEGLEGHFDDAFAEALDKAHQAIAEAEKQEPVAWMRDDEMKAMVAIEKQAWIEAGLAELVEDYNKQLYTSPPQRQWVGLTDDELLESNDTEFFDEPIISAPDFDLIKFGRAIEAKLKEKNTHGLDN